MHGQPRPQMHRLFPRKSVRQCRLPDNAMLTARHVSTTWQHRL